MIRHSARPGETTKNDGQPMEIVGVAAPIRDSLFDREAGPAVYEPWGRNYRANMFLHVRAARAGMEGDLLGSIRRDVRAYDPKLAAAAGHDDAGVPRSEHPVVGRRRRRAPVPGIRPARPVPRRVGLYGVKSYIVSQRTREIGIRMALGAHPADVLSMMLKEGVAQTILKKYGR